MHVARIDLIFAQDEEEAAQVGSHRHGREQCYPEEAFVVSARQKCELDQTKTSPYPRHGATRDIGVLLKAQRVRMSQIIDLVRHSTLLSACHRKSFKECG